MDNTLWGILLVNEFLIGPLVDCWVCAAVMVVICVSLIFFVVRQ